MKTAVVAIGGNAILLSNQRGSAEEQRSRLKETCVHLANMVQQDYDIALTHGNGPQVGNLLLQNEESRSEIPAMPLDVCVAESQAQIGYMLQQILKTELNSRGIEKNVTTIITQVLVDESDPAFGNPSKPIGAYYTAEQARELEVSKGWKMMYDRRGGYRRVVPSPRPLDIIEKATIRRLLFTGTSDEIVIVAGGGGIPVIRRGGKLIGVEAVIDKDLASAVLAAGIQERLFIMLTDVPQVFLNYGRPGQRPLEDATREDMKALMGEGHFPPGSMGPKVEASIYFLEHGGESVIITNPESLDAALRGEAGTRIRT